MNMFQKKMRSLFHASGRLSDTIPADPILGDGTAVYFMLLYHFKRNVHGSATQHLRDLYMVQNLGQQTVAFTTRVRLQP